jgi:hypothetical protein
MRRSRVTMSIEWSGLAEYAIGRAPRSTISEKISLNSKRAGRNWDATGWPIPKQVDYRLIGSALSRVRWELDVNPRWKRDPNFYIAQTLTPVVEALTVPGPYDEARSREILTRIENIPSILEQAGQNLDKPPAPFATVTIQALDGVRERLRKMASALLGSTTLKEQELNSANAAGRKIQPPGLPRFRLEKRQRPDRVAALGIFGSKRHELAVKLCLGKRNVVLPHEIFQDINVDASPRMKKWVRRDPFLLPSTKNILLDIEI